MGRRWEPAHRMVMNGCFSDCSWVQALPTEILAVCLKYIRVAQVHGQADQQALMLRLRMSMKTADILIKWDILKKWIQLSTLHTQQSTLTSLHAPHLLPMCVSPSGPASLRTCTRFLGGGGFHCTQEKGAYCYVLLTK